MIIRNPPRRWKRLLSITGGAQYPRIGTKRGTSTLKGSPITLFGHSFRVLASIELVIRGCSLRSYPRLPKRRPRCGLFGGMIADNHFLEYGVSGALRQRVVASASPRGCICFAKRIQLLHQEDASASPRGCVCFAKRIHLLRLEDTTASPRGCICFSQGLKHHRLRDALVPRTWANHPTNVGALSHERGLIVPRTWDKQNLRASYEHPLGEE